MIGRRLQAAEKEKDESTIKIRRKSNEISGKERIEWIREGISGDKKTSPFN